MSKFASERAREFYAHTYDVAEWVMREHVDLLILYESTLRSSYRLSSFACFLPIVCQKKVLTPKSPHPRAGITRG